MTPEFEDCTEVLRSLYAFHDYELTAAEADEIRQHLMACEPCLDHFQVEDAMRLLIRRCCVRRRRQRAFGCGCVPPTPAP